MAKIPLRVYNHEIEGMIEGGRIEEAVAHCQHILKTHSMYIETYRLLGKAFLESRQFADATDIFQRVLNAVPDDFVSHVGMSIIRDDENKLDEAIWHMERAFEVQPSNSAIQGELRRLYGRRDGVEPTKIRLSRDALANMYAQGELFNQAIAEIRAVLADDPNRPDFQILLARSYFKVGQKVEAVEMAAQLLKKYPYCLDALRILVEVLPGTARAENTQVYRQRLRMLDPYSSFVTGSVFDSDQVADAAVSLERMEYQPGNQPVTSEPTWAASLGVKLDGEKASAPAPAWLTAGSSEMTSQTPPVEPAPVSGGEAGEPIPDFLRSAGWGQSDGTASEVAPVEDEVIPGGEIAQGEMPEWLKAQAPTDLSAKEHPAEELNFSGDSSLPDWLSGMDTGNGGPAASEKVVGGQELVPEAEMPEDVFGAALPVAESGWQAIPETEPEPEPEAVAPEIQMESQEVPPTSGEGGTASWLEGLMEKDATGLEEGVTENNATPEGLPDWMKATAGDESEEENLLPVTEPLHLSGEGPIVEQAAEEGLEEEELPEMLRDVRATRQLTPDEMPAGAALSGDQGVKPLGIDDSTMGWLESLAAKQGAKSEELLTKPEDRSSDMPAWLKDAADAQAGGAELATPGLVGESTIPEPGASTPIEEVVGLGGLDGGEVGFTPVESGVAGTAIEGTEEGMDWLEDLVGEKAPDEAQPFGQVEPLVDASPDWMAEPTPEPEAPVAAAEVLPEVPVAGLDALEAGGEQGWLADTNPATEQAVPEDDMTITSWLKNLDGSTPPSELAQTTPLGGQAAAVPAESIPDWLKEISDEAPEVVRNEIPSAEAPAQDMPNWLKEPEVPGKAEQESAGLAGSAGSGWQEEENVGFGQPTPTIPEEWVPYGKEGAVSEPFVENVAPKEVEPAAVSISADVTQKIVADVPARKALAQGSDKDMVTLMAAQRWLETNHLSESMVEYGKLIKRGRLLDEIIHDLREAQYRFPVDIIIWQSLGDAYMRANRLQDALDAYTKAEELLR